MNNKVGFIGGDLRTIYLIELMAEENNSIIYTYGMDKHVFNKRNIIHCEKISDLCDVNKIITAIPLSKDKTNVNAPYSSREIKINDIFKHIENKQIISGALCDENIKLLNQNNNQVIDLLKNEELAILNSIPTAEGAIEIAMKKGATTIHGSNCLVMGFGRIGKILAKMLNGLGANTYCEARKEEDLAKIKSYNYNAISLQQIEKNLSNMDYIFNTIPHLILDRRKLEILKKSCIIIDLASNPGGVDFDAANELKIQASLELALPGRVAPKTSAIYIKNIINKI